MKGEVCGYREGDNPFFIPIGWYRKEKDDLFSFWARCAGVFLRSKEIYDWGVEYHKVG